MVLFEIVIKYTVLFKIIIIYYTINREKPVLTKIVVVIQSILGGYPGSNRELTVPHTVVLPIELHPPFLCRGDSNTHK